MPETWNAQTPLFNPPPGWDMPPYEWQRMYFGTVLPADYVPQPGLIPAPAGWVFWRQQIAAPPMEAPRPSWEAQPWVAPQAQPWDARQPPQQPPERSFVNNTGFGDSPSSGFGTGSGLGADYRSGGSIPSSGDPRPLPPRHHHHRRHLQRRGARRHLRRHLGAHAIRGDPGSAGHRPVPAGLTWLRLRRAPAARAPRGRLPR
jgi:hypothetical protein